jgi:hypothetical protein
MNQSQTVTDIIKYLLDIIHQPVKAVIKTTEYKQTQYMQNKNPTTDKPALIIITNPIKLAHNHTLKLDRIVSHFLFNQSSSYGIYRCHAVLCIVLAMFIIILHVSNYSVVDTMPVGNVNLYVVLEKCSSYF